MPPAVRAPGSTTTRLVPSRSICLRTASLAPWPTATMAIRAATPMKTPSIVKAERIMLRQIACMAAAMIITAKLQKVLVRRAVARNGRGGCGIGGPAPGAAPRGDSTATAGFGFRTSETIWPSRMVKRSIGVGGDVGFVGDDDDGDALLAIEPHQRFHDFVRGAGIEIAGRLVGEQQTGRVDQRPRDRHPLLLAARELAGRIALAVAQTEQLERRPRPLDARTGAGGSRCGVEQRQRHVLERAGAGQKVEALEHEAQAFAAQPRPFRLAEVRHIGAFEEIADRCSGGRGSRSPPSASTCPTPKSP